MKLEEYFKHYESAHRNKYNRLCHSFGIPLIIVSIIFFIVGKPDIGWVLFGIGWLFQFVGHAIERTWPEFLKNPVYLIVGPLYFYRKIRNANR